MNRVPASVWRGKVGAAALAASVMLAGIAVSAPCRAQGGLEYALKATFIYKLAAFVEWPGSAFESPASPLNLCVAGKDPFGPQLDQAVAGQRIGSHPIVVRRLGAPDRAGGCHILYLGVSNPAVAAKALRAVHGAPVLTVTDSAFEGEAKGIVHFVVRSSRIRFEIDDEAAIQNGVELSSKLKSLAVAPGSSG